MWAKIANWFKSLFKNEQGKVVVIPSATEPPKVETPKPVETKPTQPASKPVTKTDIPFSPLYDKLVAIEKDPSEFKRWIALYDLAEIRPERIADVNADAKFIQANRARYQHVADVVRKDMPYWVIALVHMNEARFDWGSYLGNGEHIIGTGRKSTIVPIGQGPFKTWEEGAISALSSPRVRGVTDWDIPHVLQFFEGYNGPGYTNMRRDLKGHSDPIYRQIYSDYLWGGTTIFTSGRYVADHVFDLHSKPKHHGSVAVMKALGIK